MRKTVFIAGPITGGDLRENLNRATEAFVALAKAGLAPMCPHWSVYSKPAEYSDSPWGGKTDRLWCEATAMGNDQMTHADWMGVDLPWVARADAVLRLPGESAGADLEEACARDHGVPVFASIEGLVAHFAPGPLDRFPKGCRVAATAAFHEQFPKGSRTSATAVVVGRSEDGECIRVRRDGLSTIERFHRSFWEPVPPEPTGPLCGECRTPLADGADGSEACRCPACGWCSHPSQSARDWYWVCNCCDERLGPLAALAQG